MKMKNTTQSKITYTVYNPGTCANMREDKFRCEVRDGGWIADWNLFDTKAEAETWGANHNGAMSKGAASAINDMVKRWANK